LSGGAIYERAAETKDLFIVTLNIYELAEAVRESAGTAWVVCIVAVYSGEGIKWVD